MALPKSHVVFKGSHQTMLPGAQLIGRANPNSVIEVIVKVRRKKALPDLNSRPTTVMSAEQVGATYGADDKDIQATSEVLAKFGIKTVRQDAATRTLVVSGPISAMEDAFQVHLFNYKHESGDYRGRVGDLHIPAELKDIVMGVIGLDNRRAVRKRRQPITDSARRRKVGVVPNSWFTPAQLAAHYNYPPGDGKGEVVGLLEFGGGYFPADLQSFCQTAGVNVPTVNTISVDGTPTNARDHAEGEVMLDIEVVAGACPAATIAVYFAQFTLAGWIAALDAATHDVHNRVSVISVSWGYAEENYIWTDTVMQQVNETLQEAALMGISVLIASGDDGSSDGITDGKAYADFPSTSPYVLAVGGTTVLANGPDIAWKEGDGLRSDNHGSSGGGVSGAMARPTWQSGFNINSVNPGAMEGRIVPDLAANADWDASPYLLVVDGGSQPNGGTSAATPLVASLLVRINAARVAAGKSRAGYLTPVLYQTQGGSTVGSQSCTDVTSGNNVTAAAGGYQAGPGYDAVSGWGTPNGANMLNALAFLP